MFQHQRDLADPISIPLLIGSALIVSTDDYTSTDILLVVTDISLS